MSRIAYACLFFGVSDQAFVEKTGTSRYVAEIMSMAGPL